MVFVPAQKLSSIVWTPIRYAALHFRYRRCAASLCYRNRAEITVLMYELKPYPVWFSCRCKSYPAHCKYSLKLTNIITLLKSRSQHQFWGSPKKREFDRVPKPTPQKFGKKGERDKLYWNINTNEMSNLRKKSHRTLDVFYLHMDGLFSIQRRS